MLLHEKKARYALFISCLISAAFTLLVLNLTQIAARRVVSERYFSDDLTRYLAQGYDRESVSNKMSCLVTVTDGEAPVRVHIVCIDTDRHTLDVLDLPPYSYISADGFSGTLIEACSKAPFKELISRALSIKLDISMSFDAYTAGGIASLLRLREDGETVTYATGETAALDCGAYLAGDADSLSRYHRLLAGVFGEISSRGAAETFFKLMNLYTNRVTCDSDLPDAISFLEELAAVPEEAMTLHIASGAPAKFRDTPVWCLDRKALSKQLNKYFRVKDSDVSEQQLGVPDITAGEYPFEKTDIKFSDI